LFIHVMDKGERFRSVEPDARTSALLRPAESRRQLGDRG
jgi:hypothetical protein